jgi:hypothetical protein
LSFYDAMKKAPAERSGLFYRQASKRA